jgi:hypothetical protein
MSAKTINEREDELLNLIEGSKKAVVVARIMVEDEAKRAIRLLETVRTISINEEPLIRYGMFKQAVESFFDPREIVEQASRWEKEVEEIRVSRAKLAQ